MSSRALQPSAYILHTCYTTHRAWVGHRFAAAWVRVRAAFGDGWLCYPRDDPDGLSVVQAARFSIYLSIYTVVR